MLYFLLDNTQEVLAVKLMKMQLPRWGVIAPRPVLHHQLRVPLFGCIYGAYAPQS